MIPNLFIPQRSLICHKLHLFTRTYDFPIGRTTTLDPQWRASHYLKRLLWPNIKMNKTCQHINKIQCPNNLKLVLQIRKKIYFCKDNEDKNFFPKGKNIYS